MNTEVFQASGTEERDAVLIWPEIPGTDRITVGADEAYDRVTSQREPALKHLNMTPRVTRT